MTLADMVSRWIDGLPGIPAAYLFGSRVRGDHRPDSDVDLCVFLSEWSDSETVTWWMRQNREDFAELKIVLPGPLKIYCDEYDAALGWVRAARRDPSRVVLQIRKTVWLRLPSKTERDNVTT